MRASEPEKPTAADWVTRVERRVRSVPERAMRLAVLREMLGELEADWAEAEADASSEEADASSDVDSSVDSNWEAEHEGGRMGMQRFTGHELRYYHMGVP